MICVWKEGMYIGQNDVDSYIMTKWANNKFILHICIEKKELYQQKKIVIILVHGSDIEK